MRNTLYKITLFALCCVVLIAAAPRVAAHKYYASLAQIDYNQDTRSLEIAVRMFADDLELALRKANKRKVSLEKDADAKDLILRYLQEHLEIQNGDQATAGETKKLRFVGMEAQVDSMWVYVECPLPEGVRNLRVRDTLFFELYAEQLNTAIVKVGERKADLVWKRGDDWQIVFAS